MTAQQERDTVAFVGMYVIIKGFFNDTTHACARTHACMHARTHAHTHTHARTHARTHAHAHAHAHTHTHTQALISAKQ